MIVCCGEALIDFLPAAIDARPSAFVPTPGGSPFNVAIALARLGIGAGFFGGLSTDTFGEMLRRTLVESGVDLSFVEPSPRPSTLAFVSHDAGQPRYTFYDEGSAGRMLTEADLPAFPTTVTALHFGSFSLATEPSGSAFEALMQREQRNCVISLDPNIRATLIKNRDGYLARFHRLVEMSDIVRLSEGDLAWISPGVAFAEAAGDWLARGAKLVVLTKGAAGAEARSKTASISAPAMPATVVDSVGAGDAFMAGMLASLERQGLLTAQTVSQLGRRQILDALTLGAKVAAVTLSRPGADPPWLREVS